MEETNNNPWISFLNLMAMLLSPFRRSRFFLTEELSDLL
jgi:hypothetical protein